jgi:hypothetical protein
MSGFWKGCPTPAAHFAFAGILACLVAHGAGAESLVLGPAVDLSGTYSGRDPVLVSSRGKVLVFWSRYGSPDEHVIVRESRDRGQSFSQWRVVRELRRLPTTFAVQEDSIFTCWSEYRSANNQVFFSASYDAGATFSPPVDISPASSNAELCWIVATKRSVRLFWRETSGNDVRFYLGSSQDGGRTFSAPVTLLRQKVDLRYPSTLAVTNSEDVAYVAWGDQPDADGMHDVYFASILDSASKPQFERRLTTAKITSWPSVFAIRNEAFVVWDTDAIVLARLFPPFVSTTYGPKISTAGPSSVILGWEVASGPRRAIELVQSVDGGRTFSQPILVSVRLGYSTGPVFAIGRTVTFAAWASLEDSNQFYFGAVAFKEGRMVSDVPARIEFQAQREWSLPQIAVVDDSAVIAWREKLSPTDQRAYARQILIKQ